MFGSFQNLLIALMVMAGGCSIGLAIIFFVFKLGRI
jgi:hypothetical protein